MLNVKWRKLTLIRKEDDGSATITEIDVPDDTDASRLIDDGSARLAIALASVREPLLEAAALQLRAIESLLQRAVQKTFPEHVRTAWRVERQRLGVVPRSDVEVSVEQFLTGATPSLSAMALWCGNGDVAPRELHDSLAAACQPTEAIALHLAELAATSSVLDRRAAFESSTDEPLARAGKFLREERIRSQRKLVIAPETVASFEAIARELFDVCP